MLCRTSGVSMVTRSEMFVLGVVRLSRVVLCSFCTYVGRVGLVNMSPPHSNDPNRGHVTNVNPNNDKLKQQ